MPRSATAVALHPADGELERLLLRLLMLLLVLLRLLPPLPYPAPSASTRTTSTAAGCCCCYCYCYDDDYTTYSYYCHCYCDCYYDDDYYDYYTTADLLSDTMPGGDCRLQWRSSCVRSRAFTAGETTCLTIHCIQATAGCRFESRRSRVGVLSL